MSKYGKLFESDGCYVLEFERYFKQDNEKVFQYVTQPDNFTQWYPFATGEMELKEGGLIHFDDGEGEKYHAVITSFNPPNVFAFREVDDLLYIELEEDKNGSHMIFRHTFDDPSWSAPTAAGWHRCLDALKMLVDGRTPEWPDNAAELREFYLGNFDIK